MNPLRVLSLFSGIGAMEKALTNVGIAYEVVGFSEVDPYAITSYQAIHSANSDLSLGSVSELDLTQLPPFDLLTYGFPCQDISIAGRKKGLEEQSGTRSSLLWNAMQVIEHHRPTYLVAENVTNLLSKSFEADVTHWLDTLKSWGYRTYVWTLNAKHYGLPQNRNRVFVVSVHERDTETPTLSCPEKQTLTRCLNDLLEPTVEPSLYLKEDVYERFCPNPHVLKDFPSLRKVGNIYPSNAQNGNVYAPDGIAPTLLSGSGVVGRGIGSSNAPKIVEELVFVGGIEGRDWIGDGKSLSRNYPQGNRVYGTNGIAVTQVAQGGGFGGVTGLYLEAYPTDQPCRIRRLSAKECWRIMGFADEDFERARQALNQTHCNGNDRSASQLYKQAGNSIAVPVAEAVFRELFANRLSKETEVKP